MPDYLAGSNQWMQPGTAQQQQQQQQPSLSANQIAAMFQQALSGLQSQQPSWSAYTYQPPAPIGAGYVAPIGPPDLTQAQQAAYGTAKDQVGQAAQAALRSLADTMAGRGMLGSGAMAEGIRDITSQGLGQLGQVSRDLAQQQAQQAADFAKLGYQGSIEQRGQDIQAQEAQARLAQEMFLQQQALATQRAGQYMNLLTSLMGGLMNAMPGQVSSLYSGVYY